MKPVTIKVQKIIACIPGLNILCIPIWLYNSFYYERAQSTLFRSLTIILSSAALLTLLQMLGDFYLPNVGRLLGSINSYLIPAIIGFRLIKLQEKIDV